MADYLIKGFIAEQKILAIIGNTTELVEESRLRHNTLPTATVALGRTLTLVGILSTTLKANQTLSIQIIGTGPLKEIYCQTDWLGNVRGYVKNPFVHLPESGQGRLNVERAVGKGMLYLIRDLGLKEPFRGASPIISGGIARDLAYYFTISEQKPSAVSAGVYIERDNSVKAAGGFIIQPVLEPDQMLLSELTKNIESLPTVSSLIREGVTPEGILKMIAHQFDSEILLKTRLHYKCRCSKNRSLGALAVLGDEVIKEMIVKEEPITMRCDFCGNCYQISIRDLSEILDSNNNSKF